VYRFTNNHVNSARTRVTVDPLRCGERTTSKHASITSSRQSTILLISLAIVNQDSGYYLLVVKHASHFSELCAVLQALGHHDGHARSPVCIEPEICMQRIIGAAIRAWKFLDVSIAFLVDREGLQRLF
jgi:hypothetical protein